MENNNFENFGGKGKARRLARLIRKGKGDSPRAKRLAEKVQNIVTKLEEKGKTGKGRYKKITDKLKDTGVLTIKEMEELQATEDVVVDENPELTTEIDEEISDTKDTTKIVKDTWIPKVPNWLTITVPVVITVSSLLFAYRKKIFK